VFFTDDPGLYASIAKNLIYKKEFFQLFTYNTDWLDKPHFPFWAVMVSFKLFGISTWAYRLPAFLFFMMSVMYTWLFTRRYYNWEAAAIAVLILMTAQHVLLSNTDTRAEPYLMGLITGSIYHIARLEKRYTFIDLLLAALFTACAVMTKGIFVIGAIYGSLLGQLLFQKRFSTLFQWKWYGLFLLTFIFTLPEFYALYVQFDLHPEKLVFGRHQVSGIRWFLWDSQFGRFVNKGPISQKNSGSVFFYLHTLLWAFLPWCLLFYYMLFKNIKAIFQREKLPEYYALSGGLVLLLLFSLSRFQLPFYTNAVFPLFAIITAPFIHNQLTRAENKFRLIGQGIIMVLLPLVIIALNFLVKPEQSFFFVVDVLLFAIVIALLTTQVKALNQKIFFLTCSAALFAGFYLNTVFYIELVPYQGQVSAADYINQKPFDKFPVYSLKPENNIFQFYCKRPVDYVAIEQFNNFKPKGISLFYINQHSLDYLMQTHADFRIVRSFINYPQENILPKFLNRATRSQVLDHVYLITK